ncbi:ribosomal biogenesis protein LAS1L [Rhincodon typus]|uniref:ribosomal biogenesis protein LAS1L n=1 Tax=Rhincodon typus TaxID=259920 RepID=UPI00202EC462|nr:ribosomal biogenesis protein LAS1L [Rhincodon typus]
MVEEGGSFGLSAWCGTQLQWWLRCRDQPSEDSLLRFYIKVPLYLRRHQNIQEIEKGQKKLVPVSPIHSEGTCGCNLCLPEGCSISMAAFSSPLACHQPCSSCVRPRCLSKAATATNIPPAAVYKARELLTSFEKEQFQVLMEQKLVSKAKRFWSTPTPEVEWILSQVKKHALENRELVVDILLDDGFLIPTEEQLKFLNIDCPGEFVDLSNPGIPRTFCRFWQPLFKCLHTRYFTPVLLEKLFAELKLCCDTSGLRIQYVTGWITEILAANAKAGKRLKGLPRSQKIKRSMWQLFLFQCPLDWHDLLESCLAAPCQATPHLLQQILTDMDSPLPISTQQKLLQLCSIYIQEPGSFSVSDFPVGHGQLPVYTVENLQLKSGIESPNELTDMAHMEFRKNIEPLMIPTSGEEMAQTVNLEMLSEKIQALEGSVWQICTDQIAWKDYPLGKIPGQKEDPDCLLVDNYTLMPVLHQPITEDNLDDFNPALSATGLPCADSEGLWWTQSDLHRLKAGLKLF